ncbi:MAG: hypothetical protein ACJAX4_004077 [Clostridium sp.]
MIISMRAPIFKHKIILLVKHVFKRRTAKFYRHVKCFMQKKWGDQQKSMILKMSNHRS